MSESSMSPPNPYRTLGVVLLVTPFLFGLLLFAMAATVVDEQALEDSIWGTVLLFIPNGVGALLLFFGGRIPSTVATVVTQRRLVVGAGLVGVLFGLLALTQGRDGDPNIGGSLLLLSGLCLVLAGIVVGAWLQQRQPPPPGPQQAPVD